ncbi:hypothetical protein JCM17844_05460 [Iodidimonas gelatinilytica]|uniref:Uncharacterized protein n=1 Tax=Iodidimonas gelatinilytica TaxID=1236966 RepID=A0A5A7MQ09_9PROT|nr:hypothetical protein JCM17844_05460 [Iodidimonas gelatinilytica]
MQSDDYAEFAQLVRRVEFLELKASHLWKYRKGEIREAYSDVCDTRFVKQESTTGLIAELDMVNE